MVFYSHLAESVNPVVDIAVDPRQLIVGSVDRLCALLPKETKPDTPLGKEWEHMVFQHVEFGSDGNSWERGSVDRHELFNIPIYIMVRSVYQV